jgi:DNA modification methylase
MHKMKDNFLDMVLTSPPYDKLRTYNGTYSFDFEEIALELYRVLKPGGVLVWIVGDATVKGSETLTSFKQALFFQQIGFWVHDTMIYEKKYFKNSNPNRYYNCFEYMFILSKDKPPKTTNLIRDRKNKTAGNKIYGTQRTQDGKLISKSGIGKTIKEYGVRGNIWSYPAGGCNTTQDKIAYQHPAIMKEQLAHDHIITWSNPGDIVYDCFAGSGTTGKIAYQLKRKFILSEIQKDYIHIIHQRLNIIESNPVIYRTK